MITNLDTAIAMINDDTKVIPGHGELATRTDMIKFRDALKDITEGVKRGIEKGQSLDDIQSSEITKKYDEDWGDSFVKGKDFIMFVYEDLAK